MAMESGEAKKKNMGLTQNGNTALHLGGDNKSPKITKAQNELHIRLKFTRSPVIRKAPTNCT